MLTLTNAVYTSGGTQFDIPTYNFRAHLPALPYGAPNGVQAITFFDDGGAVWINGTLGLRHRDDATNVFGVYSGNPYAVNPASDAIYEGIFNLPGVSMTAANNVVAVEVKQADTTNSDVTMGLILIGLYDSFAPTLHIDPVSNRPFNQATLTWSSGTLEYNTNLSRGSGWQVLPGATSPYTIIYAPSGGTNMMFFRLH